MPIHRRSFLKLTGGTAASAGFAIGAPAILRAATPVKMTLPWLPLGTFSYSFVAKKMGFWEKRGLDVTLVRRVALDHGFERFNATMLPDNREAIGLLHRLRQAAEAGDRTVRRHGIEHAAL